MKKLKRISAALMVILLAGLFVAAIVLAITGAPANQLMAVIFSIVFISVLFYAMGLMITPLTSLTPLTPELAKLELLIS